MRRIYYHSILIIALAISFSACHTQRKTLQTSNHATSHSIQNKYAHILGVPEKDITNLALYQFINNWYGVPYKYAGKTKKGVDCSDFVSILYKQVYHKAIFPPAASMYLKCSKVPLKKLREGDLVFFKINSKKISHVGVYLQNNKFVHASVHKGIVIDNLNEAYYKKYFFKGGKLK